MLNGEKGRNLLHYENELDRDRWTFRADRGRADDPWDGYTAVERLSEIWTISKADTDRLLRQNLRALSVLVASGYRTRGRCWLVP